METDLEISVFKKKGLSRRQIARKPSISRNTVKNELGNLGVTKLDQRGTHWKNLHRKLVQVMPFGKVVVMSQPAP
jgi:hypothetical protein